MRIESKHLFSENISPLVKSIILKKRAGIKLTEQETRRLELESRRLNEVVSVVQPSKYHDRTSPTGRLLQTWGKEDEDLDDEVDLEEILREMGYGEDEEEVVDLDEILKEMGYSEELDDEEEEEFERISDEEYHQILRDLGLE